MKKFSPWIAAGLLAFSAAANATNISFQPLSRTLPSSRPLEVVRPIAITYAGNKFVGSTYFDDQLYSTDLNGGSVAAFGTALPENAGSVGRDCARSVARPRGLCERQHLCRFPGRYQDFPVCQ